MDIIFNKKRKKNVIFLFLALAISGCGAFDNEPQLEITVVDSNQNLIENATVTLLYATNPDYEFEGGTQTLILTEKEWAENYAVEMESTTNEAGIVLFSGVSEGVKFCRVSKGTQSNNLSGQFIGRINTNNFLKTRIEIK